MAHSINHLMHHQVQIDSLTSPMLSTPTILHPSVAVAAAAAATGYGYVFLAAVGHRPTSDAAFLSPPAPAPRLQLGPGTDGPSVPP
eukprot:1159529-Pelagomonas_calceolata.AAC.11